MAQIPNEIQKLMSSNAYQNSNNPDHKEVAKQVNEYFQKNFKGTAKQDATGRLHSGNMVYKWQSEAGGCDKCQEMDGKIFESMEELEGIYPAHPNCHCKIVEVIEDENEGVENDDMIYDEKNSDNSFDIKNIEDLDIAESTVKLINGEEGFVKIDELHMPYDDKTGEVLTENNATGYSTVGYGHLIKNDSEFQKYKNGITDEEALELFKQDMKNAVDDVKFLIKHPLTQNQFDTMVSMAYNLGRGHFKQTGIHDLINQGSFGKDLEDAFKSAINTKGQPSEGLKNRRDIEWKNFIKE